MHICSFRATLCTGRPSCSCCTITPFSNEKEEKAEQKAGDY